MKKTKKVKIKPHLQELCEEYDVPYGWWNFRWTDGDGRRRPLYAMSQANLQYALSFLERTPYIAEYTPDNGEWRESAVDVTDFLNERPIEEWIAAFRAELARRDLEND